MEFDPETKDAAAIITAVTKLSDERMLDVKHPNFDVEAPLIVLPEGRSIASVKHLLDEWAPHPDRARGTTVLTTLASFVDHVNRMSVHESVIFAVDEPTRPALIAVYDYHDAQGDEKDGEGAPGFCEHRAQYTFPLSDEWKAWQAANGKQFSMSDFAEFIEDRLVDVILPEDGQDSTKEFALRQEITLATPRQLMALSRGLKVNVDMRVENSQNLQSGESTFVFTNEHKDVASGQPLRVPGGFALSIPVFRGGALYDVQVVLRYRVSGGKVTWIVNLYRPDRVIRTAVEADAEKARVGTGLPLFYGVPEQAQR